MRFLIDQNLSPVAAVLLREMGYEAVHVAEIGMKSASDRDIMAEAVKRDAVIVTRDIDFHALLALTGAVQPSVIRLDVDDHVKAPRQASLVVEVLAHHADRLKDGVAIAINDRRIRLRELPML